MITDSRVLSTQAARQADGRSLGAVCGNSSSTSADRVERDEHETMNTRKQGQADASIQH